MNNGCAGPRVTSHSSTFPDFVDFVIAAMLRAEIIALRKRKVQGKEAGQQDAGYLAGTLCVWRTWQQGIVKLLGVAISGVKAVASSSPKVFLVGGLVVHMLRLTCTYLGKCNGSDDLRS